MAANLEFLYRVLLSMVVGALMGIEREYSKRQQTVGARSFALVSLLGCVSVILSEPVLFDLPLKLPFLPYIGLLVVIGYAFLVYYFMAKRNFFGITTELALPMAYLLGMLIGYGFYLAAIIGAVIVTLLLYSRRYSHLFVKQLTEIEVADALQFAIVLFIVYPLLGDDPISVYGLLLPLKNVVEIIILLSFMSFLGFLAIRFAGQRAIPFTGFFGGFISSLAVTASLSGRSKDGKIDVGVLCTGISAANLASMLGDIVVIIYASAALLLALWPAYLAMMGTLLAASIPFFRHRQEKSFSISLGQPFSVKSGVKIAVGFLLIMLATQYIAEMGELALVAGSFLAGMVSTTSVVVSLSLQVSAGTMPINEAAHGIFAAIAGSLIAKAGVTALTGSRSLGRRMVPILMLALALGAITLFLTVQ